jgi:hypothetical protein
MTAQIPSTDDQSQAHSSSADQDRLLDEGQDIFVRMLRLCVRSTPSHDPLAFGYLVVHPTSSVYQTVLERGARPGVNGFAILSTPREAVAEAYGIPAHDILCVVSAGGGERVIGFAPHILFDHATTASSA